MARGVQKKGGGHNTLRNGAETELENMQGDKVETVTGWKIWNCGKYPGTMTIPA